MKHEEAHLSDQQLLRLLEGELSAREEKLARSHLEACWACRARGKELDETIAAVVRAYQGTFEDQVPPIAGPRAQLKAQLQRLSREDASTQSDLWMFQGGFARAAAAGIAGLLLLGLLVYGAEFARRSLRPRVITVSSPDSALTPGATLLANRGAVCSQANVKNRSVPAALRRAVFQEYGLQGADPRGYEVDYLVTPGLGGADDIHNLWPHSYSSTEWNALVKDALEDRLRDLVCDGSLDLGEAQHEIAGDWIAAYKKYFQTDRPLAEHLKGRSP